MSTEININLSSFGQLSTLADSLIIELSENLIQFCEIQSEQNKPLFICSYPIDAILKQDIHEHFLNAINHFRISKKDYKHVYINYFDSKFTLCPTNFYNPENNRTLLEFNSGSTNEKVLLVDDINTDIKLIYSIGEELKSTFDLVFPHHQIKHTLTVLSKLILQTEELINENIVLYIHKNYIEITVKTGSQLLLANQFSIKTEEDMLYYVLFILEQYQLNPLTVHVTVAGNIDSTARTIQLLKKYIKHIRLATGNKAINWNEINGLPQHFSYTILNRLFCE